jgi:hypothetical protein
MKNKYGEVAELATKLAAHENMVIDKDLKTTKRSISNDNLAK